MREATPQAARVIRALRQCFGARPFSAQRLIRETAKSTARSAELAAALQGVCTKPSNQGVGYWLKRHRRARAGEFELQASHSKHAKAWRYRVFTAGDNERERIRKAARRAALEARETAYNKLSRVRRTEEERRARLANLTREQIRKVLTRCVQRCGDEAVRAMFREVAGVDAFADLSETKFAAIYLACEGLKPAPKQEPTPAPATHSELMRSVLRPTPGTMIESSTKQAPAKVAGGQPSISARVPSWIRKGLNAPVPTMGNVRPGPAINSSIQNAVTHTESWNPFKF